MEFITNAQWRGFFEKNRADKVNVKRAKDYMELWSENGDSINPTGTAPNFNANYKFEQRLNKALLNGDTQGQNLKVYPMGLNNHCHLNVSDACDVFGREKWGHLRGFNITWCPCGKVSCAEVHSVLLHKESGTMLDITKDFDGLKEKYFLPMWSIYNHYSAATIGKLCGVTDRMGFIHTAKLHNCKDGIWDLEVKSDGQKYKIGDWEDREILKEFQFWLAHPQINLICDV